MGIIDLTQLRSPLICYRKSKVVGTANRVFYETNFLFNYGVVLPLVEFLYLCCSYTAVGVFVLGRMFRGAWGTQASKKQEEFNEFLEVFLA